MRLYLDDDSTDSLAVRLLTQAGHDVCIPAHAGIPGESDPVHLTFAVRDDRVLLSRNHDDFEELHDLVLPVRGHHPGMFIVCRENNPRRDLTPRGIVNAIKNQLAATIPLADQFVILNHWR